MTTIPIISIIFILITTIVGIITCSCGCNCRSCSGVVVVAVIVIVIIDVIIIIIISDVADIVIDVVIDVVIVIIIVIDVAIAVDGGVGGVSGVGVHCRYRRGRKHKGGRVGNEGGLCEIAGSRKDFPPTAIMLALCYANCTIS